MNGTGIVATDLEGTLSSGVGWEGLRGYLLAHGQQAAYRRFVIRQLPRLLLYRLNFGDRRQFQEGWLLRLTRLFAGYSAATFADVAEWVVAEELWPKRHPEVVAELKRHASEGRHIVVVSGQYEPILESFAKRLASEGIRVTSLGTPLRFAGGTFTGGVEGGLNVGARKVARLEQQLAGGHLLAAYGDTFKDIPMLQLAAEPIAVYPDNLLRETAAARGWRILEKSD